MLLSQFVLVDEEDDEGSPEVEVVASGKEGIGDISRESSGDEAAEMVVASEGANSGVPGDDVGGTHLSTKQQRLCASAFIISEAKDVGRGEQGVLFEERTMCHVPDFVLIDEEDDEGSPEVEVVVSGKEGIGDISRGSSGDEAAEMVVADEGTSDGGVPRDHVEGIMYMSLNSV